MLGERGGASYTVDWSGQGYEQLAQQMRAFLDLKKQVDAEMRRGIATGPRPSGIVGPSGQALVSSQRSGEYAQQQAQAAVAQQRLADARRQAQEEQTYSRAERQAKQADTQAERTANAASRRETARQNQEERTYSQAHRQAQQAEQSAERTHNLTTPNVFAGISNQGLKTDKEWEEYHTAIQARYKTALQNNEELNGADRRILNSSTQLAGMGEKAAKGGMLGKAINSATWLPGIPSQAYLGAMALGEQGIGLGPVGVAAGLAVGAYGGLSMGVFNTSASNFAMQRLLAGVSPGGDGSTVRPADQSFADRLTNVGAGYRLSQSDVFKLIPTAAQYNLGDRQTISDVISGGLVRASEGQVTNDQGVQLQALVTSRMGGDANAASRAFLALNDAITQTGANVNTVYNDLLRQGEALKEGTNLAGFAAIDASLKGTGVTATDLVGGAIGSSGVQRLSQAAVLGMGESAYTALQQDPAAMAKRLQQYAQQLMAQTGSQSATEALLEGAGFISNPANADQTLNQYLRGTIPTPPTVLGPPVPAAILDQQTRAEQAAAMVAAQGSTTVGSNIGIAAQQVMRALAAGNQDVNSHVPVPGAVASLVDWPAVAVQSVRHLVEITVKDTTGRVVGTATTQVSGTSTQTPTTTPGPGPTQNVNTSPSATPTKTNANGR